jgi:methylated-DNA-[protein]-cysteine S-methyltransferase
MLLLTSLKTPIGKLSVIARDGVLLAAGFGESNKLKSGLDEADYDLGFRNVRSISGISDLLSDYFDGDLSALDKISVRQLGGDFSQRAWKSMRRTRAGKTITYAELATKAGSPAAVRAAGTACARNLIAVVVPCHRIVKTGGALGNYAYGLKSKEWLLRHEGALQ